MSLSHAPSRAVQSLCSFSRTNLAPLTGLTHTEIARLSTSESCSKTILARPSGDRFGAELYDTERLFAQGRQRRNPLAFFIVPAVLPHQKCPIYPPSYVLESSQTAFQPLPMVSPGDEPSDEVALSVGGWVGELDRVHVVGNNTEVRHCVCSGGRQDQWRWSDSEQRGAVKKRTASAMAFTLTARKAARLSRGTAHRRAPCDARHSVILIVQL